LRCRHVTLVAALGLAALGVVAGVCFGPLSARHAGPETLPQAAAIADRLGLYHRGDTEAGTPVGRLIISEMPLTWERANNVRLGDPHDPCWAGTVAVYAGLLWDVPGYDPMHAARWGKLYVCGDPALIRRLISG
jgi:hypothetical protein